MTPAGSQMVAWGWSARSARIPQDPKPTRSNDPGRGRSSCVYKGSATLTRVGIGCTCFRGCRPHAIARGLNPRLPSVIPTGWIIRDNILGCVKRNRGILPAFKYTSFFEGGSFNRRIQRCAGCLHPPALRATLQGGIEPLTRWVSTDQRGVAAVHWEVPPSKGDQGGCSPPEQKQV